MVQSGVYVVNFHICLYLLRFTHFPTYENILGLECSKNMFESIIMGFCYIYSNLPDFRHRLVDSWITIFLWWQHFQSASYTRQGMDKSFNNYDRLYILFIYKKLNLYNESFQLVAVSATIRYWTNSWYCIVKCSIRLSFEYDNSPFFQAIDLKSALPLCKMVNGLKDQNQLMKYKRLKWLPPVLCSSILL